MHWHNIQINEKYYSKKINIMLYIISGTSRSGKSLIAKKIMQKLGVPYLSLDWLVMGFTKGIPEYGIHDKLWPNEIAERLWSFLKAMLENMIWSETDYIIEGEAVLPELVHGFLKKHPGNIKICFVGYANISVDKKVKEVYDYSIGRNDWLTNEPVYYVENHVRNMVEYSKRIEKSCVQYGIRYFDTSQNFTKTFDQAIEYLLQKQ
jgi:2-phosphoglycerate kinase